MTPHREERRWPDVPVWHDLHLSWSHARSNASNLVSHDQVTTLSLYRSEGAIMKEVILDGIYLETKSVIQVCIMNWTLHV